MLGRARRNALIVGVCLVLTGGNAVAAVVFTRVGDDLLIELQQDLSLSFSSAGGDLTQALVIDRLFSAPVSYRGRGIVFDDTIAVTITGGRRPSTIAGTWGILDSQLVDLDTQDFYMGFNMRGAFSGDFSPGDKITFSAGSGTIRDYFDEGGVLPDLAPSTIRVIEGMPGSRREAVVAGPSAIPEPTHVSLIAASLGMGLFRRNRKANKAAMATPNRGLVELHLP